MKKDKLKKIASLAIGAALITLIFMAAVSQGSSNSDVEINVPNRGHPRSSIDTLITIDSRSIEGTTFIAPTSGVYKITIVEGAYTPWDLDDPNSNGWGSRFDIHINKPVEWGEREWDHHPEWGLWPLDPDCSVGKGGFYPTFSEAEAAGIGSFTTFYLEENEYAILLISDWSECYGDNHGNITARITEAPEAPVISIYTDKSSYTTGDTMYLGLDVKKPSDSAQRVMFDITLVTPEEMQNITLIHKNLFLPAGLDYSNPKFKVFTLPNLQSGRYVWRAAIHGDSGLLCRDSAKWAFVSTRTPTEEITEVLEQTTVEIDFEEKT